MSWALNILEDTNLPRLCEWDAVKLHKFNGKKWVQFIHEPWTASRVWAVQVTMFSANIGDILLILIFRLRCQKRASHYVSRCMPTKPVCRHSVLRRVIQSWLNLVIFLNIFGTVRGWVQRNL
jgi:hypothetical protein